MPKGPNQLGTRLKEVIDDLIDSARQVALPGWIWLVGLIYPSIKVSLELENLHSPALELSKALSKKSSDGALGDLSTWLSTWEELVPNEDLQITLLGIGGSLLFLFAVGLPVALAVSRLHAGLAACASPERWRRSDRPAKTPSLGFLWASGIGMGWSSFGVAILLGLMRVIAFTLLVGAPILFFQGVLAGGSLEENGALFAIIYLPLAGILILYSLVIGALHQLALHSLVENRRGMTSALRHAWRLLRVNAQMSFAYILVEISCVLVLSLVVLVIGLSTTIICILAPVGILLIIALQGFAGVLRAAYWSRAYRQMGGATSADRLGGIGASPSQG